MSDFFSIPIYVPAASEPPRFHSAQVVWTPELVRRVRDAARLAEEHKWSDVAIQNVPAQWSDGRAVVHESQTTLRVGCHWGYPMIAVWLDASIEERLEGQPPRHWRARAAWQALDCEEDLDATCLRTDAQRCGYIAIENDLSGEGDRESADYWRAVSVNELLLQPKLEQFRAHIQLWGECLPCTGKPEDLLALQFLLDDFDPALDSGLNVAELRLLFGTRRRTGHDAIEAGYLPLKLESAVDEAELDRLLGCLSHLGHCWIITVEQRLKGRACAMATQKLKPEALVLHTLIAPRISAHRVGERVAFVVW